MAPSAERDDDRPPEPTTGAAKGTATPSNDTTASVTPVNDIPPEVAFESASAAANAGVSNGTQGPQSAPPPPSEPPREARGSEPPEPREGRRNRFESILPGLIRRGIEKSIEAGLNTLDRSIETGRETTGAVREAFSEVRTPRNVANAVGRALQEARLPREIAGAVFNQFDETKNDVLRIVAREVRDFLEATDLASELKAALTSLSFEVRTEVRFIPNDAGTGLRPDVRARTRIKRATRDARRERSRRHARTKRGRL